MLTVRRATLRDLASITDIYNEAIVKTVATFDTEPKTTAEQEAWFANHGPKYPIVVAYRDYPLHVRPPSTGNSTPVMYFASSDARNRAA